ncbi:hypothetical protein [Alicyclobacillus sp. SO9]|uniref:MutS-related protein n=1 Tax=Alicyclobacillus sp. SO9 TaxID=2665646 RepID=UPI0018E78B7B|nr:hypothetical protein [Alicyclobacillus sp. SO9]QQE78873.1 hypothetical protein GI364_24060 [Alicyclobacillus sp. SO9]
MNSHSRSVSEFLDSGSRHSLNWDELWEEWRPVTPYGQDAKRELKPFHPGEEKAWEESMQVLQGDIKALSQTEVDVLQSQLEKLPDIRNAAMTQQASVFSPRELLLLKQFAYYGKTLSDNWKAVLAGIWDSSMWDKLLKPFGNVSDKSFSIHHVASDTYRDNAKKLAEAQHGLSQAVHAWREWWRQKTGIAPDKEGVIRCQLPQQRDAAASLRQLANADWIQETPFESVFKVETTDTVRAFQNQRDDVRLAMDKEADEVLLRLSRTLRQASKTWQAAVHQIAHIDLRVSKTALFLSWRIASVPKAAQSIAVEEAVHPLVERRLKSAGRTYVPLNWEVPAGTSVLCGSNMGGKTVAMSVLALCQLCAQYALPVPAKRFATHLFQRVRFYAGESSGMDTNGDTRGTSSGHSTSGLSSFGTEVRQIKDAWDILLTGETALICFDEPAKSTNPIEGEALVVGTLRSLRQSLPNRNTQSSVIIATHFPQASAEPGCTQFRVRGLRQAGLTPLAGGSNVEFSNRMKYLADAMDYRVERIDTAVWSEEGLQVADWIGLPREILQESRRYREGRGSSKEAGES